jgi:hypothetical protein
MTAAANRRPDIPLATRIASITDVIISYFPDDHYGGNELFRRQGSSSKFPQGRRKSLLPALYLLYDLFGLSYDVLHNLGGGLDVMHKAA